MELTVKWLKKRWFKKEFINNVYYAKEFDNWDYIRKIIFDDDCECANIYDFHKKTKERWPFWWSFPKILFKELYIRNKIIKYSDIEILGKCDREYLIWFLKFNNN